jgi:hypothetical protein
MLQAGLIIFVGYSLPMGHILIHIPQIYTWYNC